MRTIKAAHTMVSSPQVTARWARKAPSRWQHYKRRATFYAVEITKLALFIAFAWLVAFGYMVLKFGE